MKTLKCLYFAQIMNPVSYHFQSTWHISYLMNLRSQACDFAPHLKTHAAEIYNDNVQVVMKLNAVSLICCILGKDAT